MEYVVLFCILGIIILYLILTNIRIVAQAHCFVIERLGRFQSVWQSGIHVKMPFIDRVASKISLKEQVLDFPPQSVITKDNVTMQIDSVVYARVFDAKRYTYGVEQPMLGLQNLTATTLRSVIGDMELDETLSSRAKINAEMQEILDKATDDWGIKVTRVEIKNINPPAEIEEVMTKQMRAERERRQTVLEAQAHKEAVVSRAQGDKEAKVLAAQGEAEAQIAMARGKAESIRLVYEAEAEGIGRLADSGLNDAVLRLKSLESLKDVADGQATKIFIPTNLSDNFASLGVVGEMLGNVGTPGSGVPRQQMRRQIVDAAAAAHVAKDPCLEDGHGSRATKSAAEASTKASVIASAKMARGR